MGALATILGVGDVVYVTAITGATQVVIIALQAWLARGQRQLKQGVTEAREVAGAPRRFVYDQAGNVIGSVPESDRMRGLVDYQPLRNGPDGEGSRWHETPPEGYGN